MLVPSPHSITSLLLKMFVVLIGQVPGPLQNFDMMRDSLSLTDGSDVDLPMDLSEHSLPPSADNSSVELPDPMSSDRSVSEELPPNLDESEAHSEDPPLGPASEPAQLILDQEVSMQAEHSDSDCSLPNDPEDSDEEFELPDNLSDSKPPGTESHERVPCPSQAILNMCLGLPPPPPLW